MEPKVIKEEAPDREAGGGGQGCKERAARQPTPTPAPAPTAPAAATTEGPAPRVRHKGAAKERAKTPDSPEGARLAASTASSPLAGHTSPTALGASLRYAASPVLNGSAGSSSPPLLEGGPGAGARTLGKTKRFLSTLVQFGGDISPDTGDRVRALVFSLVSSNMSIEEFHHSLQDVTNFPLRPFVVPFLRAHLPLLQREVSCLARTAKQTPQQYLRHHEHVVLDPAFSPSEASEIFHSDVTENGKRRPSDSYYENGSADSSCAGDYPLPAKRPHLLLPHGGGGGLLFSPVPPPPHLHPAADYPPHQYGYPAFAAAAAAAAHREPDLLADRRHADDEWKNIHVMLNCILSMVEKTKRALAILQHRGAAENGSGDWLRARAGVAADSSEARDIKRTAGEIMAQTIRATEDRVAEVKRRAEEAVNEVKRQAVAELQRAVAAAETKACELVASERARMEKLLLEARKQAAEEALAAAGQPPGEGGEPASAPAPAPAPPAPAQQNGCWNCGRKANETCSGCNVARYCGSFCQHRDWENHHQACCGRPAAAPDKARPCTPVGAAAATTVPPPEPRPSK